MVSIQNKVHHYFVTHLAVGKSAKGLNNAILGYQWNLGYISPSITVNWMAIAQDNDIKYLGDIDMQNGVATGKYVVV